MRYFSRAPRPLLERFWEKVTVLDGCWLWMGGRCDRGYGRFSVRHGQPILAHRFSWMLANGRLLLPHECVLHTCDVPSCVNPEHLFVGDRLVNNRDMFSKGRGVIPPLGEMQRAKTHCPQGHEYTPENTIVKRSTGYRSCRECHGIYQRSERRRARRRKSFIRQASACASVASGGSGE